MISYNQIEKLFDVDTDFDSVEVEKFLPIYEFSQLQKVLLSDYSKENVPYDKGLGRYSIGHDLSSLECIDIAAKRVTEIMGEEYVCSGHYSVKYQIKDGNVPMLYNHRDTQGGNITVDLVVDSTINWEIGIGETLYKESTIGNAIVFNGQSLKHWRPDYPSTSESDYIILMFMVFAKPDHWVFTHGKEFEKVFSKVQQIKAIEDQDSEEAVLLKKSAEDLYAALMLIKTANDEIGCARQREILGIDN